MTTALPWTTMTPSPMMVRLQKMNSRYCCNETLPMTGRNFFILPHPENQQSCFQAKSGRRMLYETCVCIYNKHMLADGTGLHQVLQVYCLTDFLVNNFADFSDVVQVKKSRFLSFCHSNISYWPQNCSRKVNIKYQIIQYSTVQNNHKAELFYKCVTKNAPLWHLPQNVGNREKFLCRV